LFLYVAVTPPFFSLLLSLIYSITAITTAGAHSEEDQRAAYLYGTYVGQAFQLIDDALDFEGQLLHLAVGTSAAAAGVAVAACVWHMST
jgi:geranylgeranyl pyrophosphate synthase